MCDNVYMSGHDYRCAQVKNMAYCLIRAVLLFFAIKSKINDKSLVGDEAVALAHFVLTISFSVNYFTQKEKDLFDTKYNVFVKLLNQYDDMLQKFDTTGVKEYRSLFTRILISGEGVDMTVKKAEGWFERFYAKDKKVLKFSEFLTYCNWSKFLKNSKKKESIEVEGEQTLPMKSGKVAKVVCFKIFSNLGASADDALRYCELDMEQMFSRLLTISETKVLSDIETYEDCLSED